MGCVCIPSVSFMCLCVYVYLYFGNYFSLCLLGCYLLFFLPSPDCYHLLLIVSSCVLPSPVSCSPVSVLCTYSPVCQSVRCGLWICLHFWVSGFSLLSLFGFLFPAWKKKFIFCFWAFVALSLPLLPVICSSIVGEICGACVLIFHFIMIITFALLIYYFECFTASY